MRPAMNAATGLVTCSLTYAAASSSAVPPISPIIRIASVCGSSSNSCKQVDEVRADDRVAAEADARRLAQPRLLSLPDGFVGERAAAAHDADLARLVDVARHDADLALAGRDDAGAVRADQDGVAAPDQLIDADHVEHRHAFGDGARSLRCRRRRASRIASAANGGGHEDHRGVRAGLLDRFDRRCRRRAAPSTVSPAFARRDAADHLRAVFLAALGVKRARLAGDALADDAGLFIDEDAHDVSGQLSESDCQ